MTTVITYGTFDLFHVGHVRLFSRAKALGSRLIVGVSSDEFNAKKGKKSLSTFAERCEVVAACRYVDDVFEEQNWEQKIEDIARFGASIFVMGDDWEKRFDYLSAYCKVVYLPRTIGISTTLIKNEIVSGGNKPECTDAI